MDHSIKKNIKLELDANERIYGKHQEDNLYGDILRSKDITLGKEWDNIKFYDGQELEEDENQAVHLFKNNLSEHDLDLLKSNYAPQPDFNLLTEEEYNNKKQCYRDKYNKKMTNFKIKVRHYLEYKNTDKILNKYKDDAYDATKTTAYNFMQKKLTRIEKEEDPTNPGRTIQRMVPDEKLALLEGNDAPEPDFDLLTEEQYNNKYQCNKDRYDKKINDYSTTVNMFINQKKANTDNIRFFKDNNFKTIDENGRKVSDAENIFQNAFSAEELDLLKNRDVPKPNFRLLTATEYQNRNSCDRHDYEMSMRQYQLTVRNYLDYKRFKINEIPEEQYTDEPVTKWQSKHDYIDKVLYARPVPGSPPPMPNFKLFSRNEPNLSKAKKEKYLKNLANYYKQVNRYISKHFDYYEQQRQQKKLLEKNEEDD